MTTLISNASAEAAVAGSPALPTETPVSSSKASTLAEVAAPPHTLASRFIILILCLALVLTTLAYGTVHSWALGFFLAGAGVIVFLWGVDAWRSNLLRASATLDAK